jgi:hypothetical protein
MPEETGSAALLPGLAVIESEYESADQASMLVAKSGSCEAGWSPCMVARLQLSACISKVS